MTDRAAGRAEWLSKLLMIVASLALAVVFAEVALRVSGRYQPPSYPPICLRPGLVEAYQPYGYRLIPSRRTTYLYPHDHPRTLSLVSNREGFRSSRELEEPDARPRLLVLGDSFVFGDGVEESERFTNVLEAMEPSWRVDNLGMVGWGPDLMLRALEAVGLNVKPRAVVFCMYTDDFRRVRPEYAGTGFLIPRYELESGRLATRPYPKPNFLGRLSISVAAGKILWNYSNWEWDLNRAILDKFEELANQQPFQKVIIFLPGVADTKADQKRRYWLRQYADTHATPFLDLSDPLHKLGQQVFISGDPHLNPMGHEVVARELDHFLRGVPVFR